MNTSKMPLAVCLGWIVLSAFSAMPAVAQANIPVSACYSAIQSLHSADKNSLSSNTSPKQGYVWLGIHADKA